LGGLEATAEAGDRSRTTQFANAWRILAAVPRWVSLPLARALLFVVVVAFLDRAVTRAQENATGVWHAGSTPSGTTWTAVLKVEGARVLGGVSSCASNRSEIEIYDGEIRGDNITFRCDSLDGSRTMTFTGKLAGDQIAFEWTKQVHTGKPDGADASLFGEAAPRRFTVTRAARPLDEADVGLVRRMGGVPYGPSVTFDRLLGAHLEPENWLTYSGSLRGIRHSYLTQIAPSNVAALEMAWVWRAETPFVMEATPLVANGVLYTTQAPNDVVALDAATGRLLWKHEYTPARRARASGGGGRPNRGLAMLGDTLFLGTLDAHVRAIDAYSGKLVWNTRVADAADRACGRGLCYVITHAPLAVKDKVVVGVGGGEGPTRGFVVALDANTGNEVWRFHTVPAAGEPGNETWAGDSWRTGGAGVWNIGAYDSDLNLTYWGTGNPYPEDGAGRAGDNLYSSSVVALDADTGALRWHYQFTPHDDQDWDAAQVPVLADLEWQDRSRRVMLWANRNGFMYVLDRATGEFLMGTPFAEVNWTSGFDGRGRPRLLPRPATGFVMPGTATNWQPSAYSPRTGLFYIPVWERGFRDANGFAAKRPSPGYGAIRAIDPATGRRRWELRVNDAVFTAGTLTTATDLVFTGVAGDFYSDERLPTAFPPRSAASARSVNGTFYALDANTGQVLWRRILPAGVQSAPMTYSVSGKQYVAVAAGNTLFAFALR
jgi:alcohol dehydrogenase (cytochrome c)